METLANGDLSRQVVIRGKDEIAALGGVVDRMGERLSVLVSEIRAAPSRPKRSGR